MSEPLNRIRERLPDSRKYGNGYRCKCPAHDGNSKSSLSIREGDDGRVLLKCFSGCGALEVVQSIGLGLKDLFERPPANMTLEEKRQLREHAKRSQWKAAIKSLPMEIAIVQIAAVKLAKGELLETEDHMRLELASDRISNARTVLCG